MEPGALGLEFEREVKILVYYKGRQIDTRRVDFVVEDCIVEIKTKKEFTPEDCVQALCYVKASGYKIGAIHELLRRRRWK